MADKLCPLIGRTGLDPAWTKHSTDAGTTGASARIATELDRTCPKPMVTSACRGARKECALSSPADVNALTPVPTPI
jgi:hypothetical protein